MTRRRRRAAGRSQLRRRRAAGRSQLRRRRAAALAGLVCLVAVVVALGIPSAGSGDPGPAPVIAQPSLGVADQQSVMMGSTPGEEPSEAWAYRQLPLEIGSVSLGGNKLDFSPLTGGAADPQLVFERFTLGSGWQMVQTPVDENGKTYRGPTPNRASVRMTPQGAGLLVGHDGNRVDDAQLVVLGRNPGGRFTVLDAPPSGVLKPAAVGQPAEALATERGGGQIVDAAFDEGGRLGALFAPLNRAVEDGVVHYDGSAAAGARWTREAICTTAAPTPCTPPTTGTFKILDLSAAARDNAWMLAQPDDNTRGVVLYQRVEEAGAWVWRERDLGAPLFANAATPADKVSEVAALGGGLPTDALTATARGVWIDGTLKWGPAASTTTSSFTLYFDPAAGPGKVTASWCDASDPSDNALCDHPLGFDFASADGYRSFAWAGDGFGTRVISNPLDPGGASDSSNGTWVRLDGTTFSRVPGAGGTRRRSAAFASPTEGWLEGPVHITQSPETGPLRRWPVAARAPFTSVAAEPGAPPGVPVAKALAVGGDGVVARYTPGQGWVREFLLTASDTVSKPLLRGVAWPQPDRAYAVGDLGQMWLWRGDTGLWEKDPGTPVGFYGNLLDVGFQADDPTRGYAVGKEGVILRYDKSWTQDTLPAQFQKSNFTSIAFAGSQALVAAGDTVLDNDGGGWQMDQGVQDLLHAVPGVTPSITVVAGLPDGGAVAAGRNVVLERESANSPWHFSDQPIPGLTPVAAAAYHDGGRVRAVLSVTRLEYPAPDETPVVDPNVPPPIIPPFPVSGEGYLLRETADGWRDEQHSAYSAGSTLDRPVKTDPILDFDLSPDGTGWAVGGWSGYGDSSGRGSSGRDSQGRQDRARVQTAGIFRYGGGTAVPAGAGAGTVPMSDNLVRFAVAGHAQCEKSCALLSNQDIGPDRTLQSALASAAGLAGQSGGPRAFLYTGGRVAPNGAAAASNADQQRFANLLNAGGLPVFPAVSSGDSNGGKVTAFQSAFGGFPAPFGTGGAPGGITPLAATAAGPGARTHYAFDSAGPQGTVRVIVIDNSSGSLALSDPHQNPTEAQAPWLQSVLADARAQSIPTIVMGSRDLNSGFSPKLNVAADADQEAQILVDGGASAYVYERPEETRALQIPSGGATTIPEYGTGTLGYRSSLSGTTGTQADQLFGESGMLLLELDKSQRDPGTNRAPVSVRLIPVIDDLSVDAVDGTLLRRSRPSLFTGLGRRPVAGDRWGGASSDGNANPSGGDPYVNFPPSLCQVAGCTTRISPEYTFTSSDPSIADFVKLDPNSNSLRKPFQDANGKVVSDNTSGLLCPFNPGTTTITLSAGGLAYAQTITVQPGTVQQPCGTRPLTPGKFTVAQPKVAAPVPPPSPAPAKSPPLAPIKLPHPAPVPPAPVPVPAAIAPAPPAPPPVAPKPPVVPPPVVTPPALQPQAPTGFVPTVVPPPPPPIARPIPPGGAVARVFQVEEKREEEVAPEESRASFAAHQHGAGGSPVSPYWLGAILLLAIAGAVISRGSGGRRQPRRARPAPAANRGRHQPRPGPTSPTNGRHQPRPGPTSHTPWRNPPRPPPPSHRRSHR